MSMEIKDYMDYEIIEREGREGYVVLKVTTYPPGPGGRIGKVIHFLPSSLVRGIIRKKSLTK